MMNKILKQKNPVFKKLLFNLIKNSKHKFILKKDVILSKKIDNYTENSGIQWNEFELTQFDSFTNLPHTENRLKKCTGWDLNKLKNKKVLEIGSGAGKYTEIFLKYGAKIVTTDLSTAIYVNSKNNKSKNVIFIRSDFKSLQGFENSFDYVFCYGMAQHTPVPKEVYTYCCKFAKNKGYVSIDHYIKLWYPSPFYFPKYFWRPVTTRISPKRLLSIIKFYIPKYIMFDIFLMKKIPSKRLSNLIRGCIPIPCWNYYGTENVQQDNKSLIQHAIMDTFDALGAKYDFPISMKELDQWAKSFKVESYSIKKGGNGLIFNAIK